MRKVLCAIKGTFTRGEVVRIRSAQGKLLAKGIVGYSNSELAQLIGKHSKEIEATLGYQYGSAIIHRDDLVVIQE